MVALYFYHPVFGRAARPAGGFKLFTQSGQRTASSAKPRTSVTLLPPRPLVSRCTRSTPSEAALLAVAKARLLAAHWHCATGWMQSGQMRPVSVE
jgi:hypothetical protein